MAAAAILKKRKSAYLRNGLTDLREIWHGDAHWASEPDRKLKFPTFKNPRWRTAAILKKLKNRHISGTVRPVFAKFGMVTHIVPPNRTGIQHF